MRTRATRFQIPLRALAALAAVGLAAALGAAGSGCGACASRRGSGIFVEIPREVFDAAPPGAPLTLKIRVRALELDGPFAPGAGLSPVINDLPEVPICSDAACRDTLEDLSGRDGLSIQIDPADDSPWSRVRAVVHLTVFANTVNEVEEAFGALDDQTLGAIMCGPVDCAHLPLAALDAVGAYSLTVERLGRSDANVVLYPLRFEGVDIDLDGDTIAGGAALVDATLADCPVTASGCAPFLERSDAPWNRQRVPACASILDPEHLDCNDGAVATNPFELEAGSVFSLRCLDGIDQDCDCADDPCPDGDGDGVPRPDDCDDTDPTIYPGAQEDGETGCSDLIDQDCDGLDVWCACDLDMDGFCPGLDPPGGIAGGDCCESGSEPECGGAPAATINPAAAEVCGNGNDENCDGNDPTCLSPDADGDGHCASFYDCGIDCASADPAGAPLCCLRLLTLDPGLLAGCGSVFDDCDDSDRGSFPGGVEVCGDGLDQDCSGGDEPCAMDDMDSDGFSPAEGDCDDFSAAIGPAAGERCGNGIDDDCVGGDVPCDALVDGDGDTYVVCVPPATTGCDCDDTNAAVNPGAAEACNDLDDDCDGIVNDGNPLDGASAVCFGNPPATAPSFVVPGGADETWRCREGRTTCDPTGTLVCVGFIEPATAGATACTDDPLCNGRNDVCVLCADGGLVPDGERDLDGDGCIGGCATAPTWDGTLVTVGDDCDGVDCNDDDGSIRPGAAETCANDNVDNDCDGDWMENCSAAPTAETCNGADEDCDCVDDFLDPDAQDFCSTGEYCNGTTCLPGCDTAADCTNGNTCSLPACVCGGGAACTGNYLCNGTLCLCGGSGCGPMETCNGAQDCACFMTTASSGEACASAVAPDCVPTVGCRCGDSTCGSGETCTGVGGDCECNGTTMPTGQACPNASAAPDCTSSGCRCQTSICGPGETCTAPGGDCACGATTAGSGEACVDGSVAPDCLLGVGCRCGDSTCGPGETCSGAGGDCTCAGQSAPSGEACATAANPNCGSTGCWCDMSSTCDGDEVCVAGACTCGSTAPASGAACPDGTPNPNCVGGACACDANSTCGMGESCVAGECTCGTTSPASGPACSLPSACLGGVCVVSCNSPGVTCGAGFVCDTGTGQCECSGSSCGNPGGGGAPDCDNVGGVNLCDCNSGPGGPYCGPGETCVSETGTPATDCMCATPTCM